MLAQISPLSGSKNWGHNLQGKLIRKILKEYIPIKVIQEDIEEKLEQEELFSRFKERLRERMNVPEYHCPFQEIIAADNGNILVMTHERVSVGGGYYYDVFDAEGRYIAKLPLKNRPLLIKKERLFAVEEDDDGYQFVKRYRVVWTIASLLLDEKSGDSNKDGVYWQCNDPRKARHFFSI